LDLGDFFAFEVSPDGEHPEIQNDGMQYEGKRFRAECRLAGKLYGYPFGVDVAFGDPILGLPESAVADDILGFAGIAPPTLLLYPVETHIAEKLHAFTMPRARLNSRVKDLPDIALLACVKPLDAVRLRSALEQTFAFRAGLPAPARRTLWKTRRLGRRMHGLLGEISKTCANPRLADARRLPHRRHAPVADRFCLGRSPQAGHALVHDTP
jgi:hypothetical protein